MPWRSSNVMDKRTEFVLKAQQRDNFRELCREFNISPRVGYKWQKRFLEHGLDGLYELSRKPRGSPSKLGEEVICRIVKLKQRHPHWGPLKLREIYRRQWGGEPSESSFKRVLERAGMTQKRRESRAGKGGRIAEGRRAGACNEVWTVDFKGWWHDPQGRCDPLTVRDEFSRYLLELRAVADARTQTVQACFERLFRLHGLPLAIRSDNGPPFASAQGLLGLSRLSVWWLALGIDLERGRPGCPQDNGAHERLHRDISLQLQGTAYGERQPAFDVWRREFNEERPHAALEMRCPGQVYEDSRRRYDGTPATLNYGEMGTRKVHRNGCITVEGRLIFLSTSLGGWDVGLSPCGNGLIEVYFARLLLGCIEISTASFLPVQGPKQSPRPGGASSATPHSHHPDASLKS